MNIVLLTQDDPFYLSESIKDFLEKIESTNKHKVVEAFISDASPFGKKETFTNKVVKTYRIFGFIFFIHYVFKFIVRKFIYKKSVIKELKKKSIPISILTNSINNTNNLFKLKKISPDIIIIIAGNQILKKEILKIPKYGVFNIHSSLLPDYRGLMPTFWVLKNKEKITGVSLYKLTEGIDNGPIISQSTIKISKNLTHSELVKKSKIIGNDLIINSLNKIKNNEKLKDNINGSYYKFPTRSDILEFYSNGKSFF